MTKKLATAVVAILFITNATYAKQKTALLSEFSPVAVKSPRLQPQAPNINAKGYVLMDVDTGYVIAERNPNKRMSPASLTKMMTMFIVSEALQSGRINLHDKVTISKKAWKMGGSKMFLKLGQHVTVENLIRGIIIVSGNDACVAMAEHIAGSEEAFVALMNQQAQLLGMTHSHFTDCTGMPHKHHYSTPHDLALLATNLVHYFPQYYGRWYSKKWFKYNGIRQPNRNRLLWRDKAVDGIKTGHTDSAGYCLVSSAKKHNMRLVSVVMGTRSDMARTEESQRMLNYGFHFFASHQLYKAGSILVEPRVWMGLYKTTPVGLEKGIRVTIPRGEYKNLKAKIDMAGIIKAPVVKGTHLGNLIIKLHGTELAKQPLIALEDDPKGGVWSRFKDYISLSWRKLWHKDLDSTQSVKA